MRWPDRTDLWEKWEGIYTSAAASEEDDAQEKAEAEALAFYEANKEAMDAGAEVSWPEVRPLYRLYCMYASDHDAFNQEQQNKAGNDDTAPFKNISFWVDRRNDWIYFGAIDPSMGKSQKSRDPSGIMVGGLNRETMVLDVVEADICRRVPDLIISRAIDLQAEYGCVAWSVEAVAFQEFLFTELIKRAALRGIAFPAMPGPTGRDKDLAILSLQPYVANGQIRLHRSQTTAIEHIKFWPEADHDEGPDTLEMLWRIAKTFGVEFKYTSAAGSRSQARSTSRRSIGNNNYDDWEDDD
jgi:predicted phage terminase large subunit-like protein